MTRDLAWLTLHRTGLAGLARTAINTFVPSRHVQELLQSQAERQKRRETIILQGAGELELQICKGLVELDDDSRAQLWAAVKSGTAGVQFSDVFDTHVAVLLETSTPGGTDEILE